MKYTFLVIASLVLKVSLGAQVSDKINNQGTAYFPLPKVDERVELLSIVFRLAGNMEYNDEIFHSYTAEIHNHFDPFKDHELIRFAREVRDKNWIGFDAVMKMAISIGQTPDFNPIMPFSSDVPDIRWGMENATEFVRLLRRFYIDAGCEDFFKAHEELYRITQERCETVYDALDLNWFKRFYGDQPKGSFNIIPGLGNGGNNYGVKLVLKDGREDIYAIIQTCYIDSANFPFFSIENNLPILIHEFNHSYVNDIVTKHSAELENAGVKLYSIVQEAMRNQSYTDWQIMMNESLVRASVIRYLLTHNDDKSIAKKQLVSEFGRGFFWIKGLVDCLGNYEKNRDKYPTLESYMPVIISFYNGVAKDSDLMFEISK